MARACPKICVFGSVDKYQTSGALLQILSNVLGRHFGLTGLINDNIVKKLGNNCSSFVVHFFVLSVAPAAASSVLAFA